ncbi:GntR family transcriptional regulator [Arenivirga flava]|uniref:HTH gntR-type domain-containing protein n=1 Tax=Arenivirga flava TaxID=1930060 RepID=A0AA37UNM4_9MICO|nr:GntR family transcriptional regulator [Arenivirga flava]GMA29517.1 hypothetical protein GCM10025874_27700 [Arenivirga flava]
MTLPSSPLRIAHALREQIITGELAMGSKLNEREIAERLEVSRIPVREALPILESEGFITSQPRRGAVVHVLTVRDAAEVFDLRRQLEPMASGFAARRAAAGADVGPMLAALHSARGAAAPDSARGAAALDERSDAPSDAPPRPATPTCTRRSSRWPTTRCCAGSPS